MSYVKWQIGSRLVPGYVIMDWVNSSKLLVGASMWGSTMNVYCGLQDFSETGFLLHLLRPEDLFVDVGANIGTYTILGGAAIGARTIALEPTPATFKLLEMNVAANGLTGKIKTFNYAAGKQAGELQFVCSENTTNHIASGHERQNSTVNVIVKPLDEIIAGDQATALKIDVEGYEIPVLEGAAETLAAPNLLAILVEVDGHGDRYGFDENRLHQLLVNAGFAACSYSPMDRKLSITTPDSNARESNRIYIRKDREQAIRSRLANAPCFSIWGRAI